MLAAEKIAEKDGRGKIVGFGGGAALVAFCGARGFCHFLMGGPTGEAFIHEFDFDAQLFFQACGETGGFFGHFTGGAVEIERVAYDNLAGAIFPGDFAQVAEHAAAIGAFENAGGTGGDAQFVGNCQADAASAVIQAQHSAW